jgi:mannobiose 2-epimerase
MIENVFQSGQLQNEIQEELFTNILPFWINHAIDYENGGFFGALSNDLVVDNSVPRSAVLTSRLLWTYSAAYHTNKRSEYLEIAEHAYSYLNRAFIDPLYGGVFWTVNAKAKPLQDYKHSYAQAFAIYGLSEYYAATGMDEALRKAQVLFELMEQNVYEPVYGGYLEGKARDWTPLPDLRLSEKEPDCRKSMNTTLHVLEAFTNLYRVWPEARLQKHLEELIAIFLDHIIDPTQNNLRLFFDDAWNSSDNMISFGHDIEASWLLVEAASVLGNAELTSKVNAASIQIAQSVYTRGLWPDNSVILETAEPGYTNPERHWWPTAEGMVGFFNAYQISGWEHFAQAAYRCWQFAREKLVDRQYGDWIKVLDSDYRPKPGVFKMGPWECPYHHARACFEMIKRL